MADSFQENASPLSGAGAPPSTAPDISLCVKCGLCLPGCPTYRLAECESASPRGRIALVQGLEAGLLAPDRATHERLSGCLGCGRCEAACPSQVPYGAIVRRGLAATGRHRTWRQRAALAVVGRPALARRLARLAGPLRWLLPAGRGRRLLARVAERPVPAPHPLEGRRGRVALFTGCSEALLDGEVLAAAARLLSRAGYEVVWLGGPACCGALASHAGRVDEARRRLDALRRRLADAGPLLAVVVAASGCAAHLVDEIGVPFRELSDFLADPGVLAGLSFRSLPARVGLHLPCTQVNRLGAATAPAALLSLIPQLERVPLGSPGDCCGAGGLTFVGHPRQAEALRRPWVERISAEGLALVVTTNAGCGFHLEGGAPGVRFIHPVTLLAEQLVE